MELLKKDLKKRRMSYLRSSLNHNGEPKKNTMIFLHGFPDTPHAWRFQFSHFYPNYVLIAPYAPGVDGEVVRNTPTLDELAIDYIELLHEQAVGEITIIAHDLGGPVAARMLMKSPDLFKSCIFLNSLSIEQMYFRKKYLKQVKKSYYIFLFQSSKLATKVVKLFWKKLQPVILKANRIDKPENYNGIEVLESIKLYKSFFSEVRLLFRKTPNKIKTTCHFIWAKDDYYLNSPTKEELETHYEDYDLEIIDGHHWLQLERPQNINELIERKL